MGWGAKHFHGIISTSASSREGSKLRFGGSVIQRSYFTIFEKKTQIDLPQTDSFSLHLRHCSVIVIVLSYNIKYSGQLNTKCCSQVT